jgi:hypothetical protein
VRRALRQAAQLLGKTLNLSDGDIRNDDRFKNSCGVVVPVELAETYGIKSKETHEVRDIKGSPKLVVFERVDSSKGEIS